ncbi:immune inhibitor A domain-containing protein, partial [Sedimenticola sp.]|uniref:immune inhibitor A domain-containing protein n=1 Tax=Sedimenticola sp. TaxID=1940285 RepID=UPI003D150E66
MFLVDLPSRKALLGVLLGFAMMFGTGGVVAAPHRSGGKSEPAQLVRSPGVAIAGRAAAQSYQFNTWPATASLLLLRVEFPADTDSLTTGTGQWADAEYAHDGDVNHWVVKNGIDETLTAPVAFGTVSTAGAISRYYQEVSYGLLTVEVTVSSSIYLMPNAMGYYGSNETGVNGYAALISDVESLVLSENLNAFDSVMIVHAGAGEETDIADDGGVTGDTPSDIWSAHILGTKYTIVPQTGTQDCGTPAQGFVGACDSAPPLNAVVDPLGVMVHEFAHWLGLPDLYNTLTGGQVIGDWGLMDTGLYNRDQTTNIFGSAPAHPIVWSKIQLGWLSP